MTPVTTTCSYCGVGCTLEVHALAGRIVKVTSPLQAPVNRGNLCVKGRFGHDYVTSPDRLTRPLVRRDGARSGRGTGASTRPGRGSLEPATWDEALERVAHALAAVRDRYGPDAVAGFSSAKCTNEENYLFQKFMRTVIGTHNVDHCARLCHASSVAAMSLAIGATAMSNSVPEIRDHADVLLVTGSNTTENHPIVALEMKAAVARGARLILIDPREIELARFATVWLRQRPGTDVAVLNGLAHVIIRDGLWNREFVEEHTEGFEAVAAAVAEYTPERVEALAGVPAALLVEAAHLYATSPAAGIYWGMGISQHTTGTDNALALVNLALLCGQIGRPGTGLNPLRGQNNVQGAGDMDALPNVLPGYVPVTDPEGRARFESLWGVPLPGAPGLASTDVTAAACEGRIRALYVMGENPLLTDANLAHARHCLEQLDFLVVQDIFRTETAEIADVVLPAWSWAEKDGTFTNTDRRVQRVRRVLDPPGEARADWDILSDLARRLGHNWQYTSAEGIFEEVRRVVPAYAGVTYARIEKEGLQWPCPTEDHPGTPYLFASGFPRGRARLYPVAYADPAELPDAEYPFVLITGRVLYHWHGGVISRHSEGLDAVYPEALVEIHPEDAACTGVQDGGSARVRSRRGEVTATVRVTDRSRPGTVFLSFHFAEAAANLLTNDALDARARIPEFKVSAVAVERAFFGKHE